MPDVATIESFIARWEPRILAALEVLGEAARRAGYATALPMDDVDWSAMPPRLMWIMPTWYPGRPEELESMDMFLTFNLLPVDDEFIPVIETNNVEGSYSDHIDLSEQGIRLDDDKAIAEALGQIPGKADDVVAILQAYFPRATKRIWTIKTTSPEGVPFNPSVHVHEEIAEEETAGLLHLMLDKIYHLLWELEAVRMYSGWSSGSLYLLRRINLLLEEGETWEALRLYHEFVDSLPKNIRDRLIKTVGTLSVERTGGWE